jgi:hypothetical protein
MRQINRTIRRAASNARMTQKLTQKPWFRLGRPLVFLLPACGGATDEGEPSPEVSIGEVRSAVVYPTQITPTGLPSQSETELAFGLSGTTPTQVVAYNDFRGSPNNLIGWSFSVNGGAWQQRTFASNPPGHNAIAGDPALAATPSDKRFIVMSHLAVPNDRTRVDRDACIHLSADGGQTFSFFQCVAPPDAPDPRPSGYQNNYDGETLVGVGPVNAKTTFAAYLNIRGVVGVESRINLWWSNNNTPFGTFVRTTGTWDPFPTQLAAGHPKLAGDPASGAVAIVAPVIGGSPLTIQLLFQAATNFGGFLGSPAVVTNGLPPQGQVLVPPFDFSDYVTLSDGKQIRQGPEFDVELGNNESGVLEARVVYVKRNPVFPFGTGDGRLHLYGARCPLTLPLTCVDVPAWSTAALPGVHEEFLPRIAYANGKWAVSYYTTSPSPAGVPSQVFVVGRSLYGDASHAPKSKSSGVGGAIIPCLTIPAAHYWTDYDDIKFNDTDGRFVTTFAGDNGCPSRVAEASLPTNLWTFP